MPSSRTSENLCITSGGRNANNGAACAAVAHGRPDGEQVGNPHCTVA